MIKVAYFDLGHSREQYGLIPTRYGGGGVAGRYLKQEKDIEFHIFARDFAFDNLGPQDRTEHCHILSEAEANNLRSYHPLDVEGLANAGFDVVLHPHTCESFNRTSRRLPIVHFCGFSGSGGHGGNDYVLFYDDSFTSIHPGTKAKYVRIGKPVPEKYIDHPRAPYIFQCSRHDSHMNSIFTAQNCRRFAIKGYFAGPIHNNYPLMEEIDNVNTFYLGEIDEMTKMGYYRHASLMALLLEWDSPFNQSIIEAQGQGCPIWVNKRGPFLNKYLKEGVNGFDAVKTNLLDAMNQSAQIKGEDCWKSALDYSVPVMVNSFKKALKEIVEEWKTAK